MGGEGGPGNRPRPPKQLPTRPPPPPPPGSWVHQSTGPRRSPRLELSRRQGRRALGWGLGGCRPWGAASDEGNLPASRRYGSHPSLEASSGWKVARVPGPPPPT